MACKLAGCERSFEDAGALSYLAAERSDLLSGDGAVAEDDWYSCLESDHGALEAVGAETAVENRIDMAVEPIEDMDSRGGGDEAEEVGAGRGERQADPLEELPRDGMGGDAEADGRELCSDDVGDDRGAGQDKREWSGPEGCSEFACSIGHRGCVTEGFFGGGQVDDERVERGAPFGLEDARDRDRVEGVCSEPVDGLRGHGDEPAAAEDGGCLIEALLVGREPARHGLGSGAEVVATRSEMARVMGCRMGSRPMRWSFW